MGCYGVAVEPDVRVRVYGDVACCGVRAVMGAGSGFFTFCGAGGSDYCFVFVIMSERLQAVVFFGVRFIALAYPYAYSRFGARYRARPFPAFPFSPVVRVRVYGDVACCGVR